VHPIVSEQLGGLAILIDFLFGITFGVIGGAVVGSRRGLLLWPGADGPLSAGSRVIFNVWARGYEVTQDDFIPGNGQVPGHPHGDDGPESPGQEARR
jgi:hypothetical protein